mgnify:CR=1 FL=1
MNYKRCFFFLGNIILIFLVILFIFGFISNLLSITNVNEYVESIDLTLDQKNIIF